MIKSWHVVFAEIEGALVLAAYMEALKHCEFPVTIADIWRELEKTTPTPDPEMEWQALVDAANWCYDNEYRRSFNGPSKRYEGLTQGQEYQRDCEVLFDKLSPVNKGFIGNVRRLVELGSRDGREQDFWFSQRYKPAFEEFRRQEEGQRVIALAAQQKLIGGPQ